MFVSDLMKAEIVTVEPENTLADAARIMLAQHVSGLPVTAAGRLVGIITEGDLLRRAEIGTADENHGWLRAFLLPNSLARQYVRTHGRFVRDAMTPDPITATPDTPLADVAEVMCTRHIKRLPVLLADRLVGVISRTDMLRSLARLLIDTGDPYTETQIRDHIIDTLARERWAPKSGIRVSVVGHTVDLEGMVFSAEEQNAVRVIAETTPGVKDVRDHMVVVDPASGMCFPAA